MEAEMKWTLGILNQKGVEHRHSRGRMVLVSGEPQAYQVYTCVLYTCVLYCSYAGKLGLRGWCGIE